MFPCYRTNIDYFYGYENENVKNWLVRFQNFLIVKGFEPHGCEAARIFPFFLRGVAQTWYYSLPDKVRHNFFDLEKAFIFRFLSYSMNTDFVYASRTGVKTTRYFRAFTRLN